MMQTSKIIAVVLVSVFFQGCTKPVDFDQFEGATIEPVYLLTLVHSNLRATDFLDDSNAEIPASVDSLEVNIPKNEESTLKKIEFTIETSNSFDRNFTFNVIFFNELNEPIYVLKPTVFIPANSSEIISIIEIPKSDIHIIYNTKNIGFAFSLESDPNGNALSVDSPFSLSLKSFVRLEYSFKLN